MKKLFQYALFVVFGALPLFVVAQTVSGSITINLSQGQKGVQVMLLQQKLQTLGFFAGPTAPTGYFGAVTKKAVQDFQKANGIDTTGFVGPLTRKALGGASVAAASTPLSTRIKTNGTRAQCLTSITSVQDNDTLVAKKTLEDAKGAAATIRDAAYTKAATALTSVKTKAAGVRDAAFAPARVLADLNERTIAIQKAIDIYNVSVNPAIAVEANVRGLALADYQNAAKKADSEYAINIGKIAKDAAAFLSSCPAK
jgi:peptidoglycan hydrolase-like protein with peptidoglycan-binding domain